MLIKIYVLGFLSEPDLTAVFRVKARRGMSPISGREYSFTQKAFPDDRKQSGKAKDMEHDRTGLLQQDHDAGLKDGKISSIRLRDNGKSA